MKKETMRKILSLTLLTMLFCGPAFGEAITYNIEPVEVVSPDNDGVTGIFIRTVTEQIIFEVSRGTGEGKDFVAEAGTERLVIFQNTPDDPSTSDIDETTTDYDDFKVLLGVTEEVKRQALAFIQAKAAESESE